MLAVMMMAIRLESLVERGFSSMQQEDLNTYKVKAKHIKGSKELYLLGQNTTMFGIIPCIELQTDT